MSRPIQARMAESVDALVSNTNVRKDVPVRPRLRVRKGLSDALSPFCVPSSQPQSAALTAPVRGIPATPTGRAGCRRCCDVLQTSC